MTAFDLRPLPVPLTALLLPTLDVDWTQARCAAPGENPDDWFPFPTDDSGYAERVCASCPIHEECLAWGRSNRMTGIWGGVRLQNGRE
ncbi:WhiB family transcriptional regulator [Gordonia sp. NB41Y]|uniref:WhiB family transcriptional regulator n=1 Tax=Gordonia sp. NB41Y TaxID=875808 RepID=UPI0002BE69E0|nr:WhiB family transcriptional regulator [Gordonia sp. NB41Y]EMP15284.1 WhiB family regulatory protein [Gordonia sp. NB41Y]WLP92850.1 WhiB family transcriptional regulator [Gordonia sp. NB41Y]